MGTVTQVRDAIAAKISAVPNVGVVHKYERFSKSSDTLKALYYDSSLKRIQAWTVRRKASQKRDIETGLLSRVDRWQVSFFMGMNDADQTGILFDDLLQTVVDAFDDDPTLGGVTDIIRDNRGPYGLQVDDIEPVVFAGLLCHRASLTLMTDTTE